jgi:transposase-like protein
VLICLGRWLKPAESHSSCVVWQKVSLPACQRQSRENPTPHAYPEERREEILRAYEERSSLRGLERTFGVSRKTVITWIKKSRPLASVERNADRA